MHNSNKEDIESYLVNLFKDDLTSSANRIRKSTKPSDCFPKKENYNVFFSAKSFI